eukprot:scaffold3451_cov109-Cylindrotheca_fusiformis.AAC.4
MIVRTKSNNALKKWPKYDEIVAEASTQMILFEDQNGLDRKLYSFMEDAKGWRRMTVGPIPCIDAHLLRIMLIV